MNLKPLFDRVVMKRLPAEEPSGLIVIPEANREPGNYAEVVAIGPGRRDTNGNLIPIEIKVGDVVVIGQYVGQPITVDGQEYLLANAGDILGIRE